MTLNIRQSLLLLLITFLLVGCSSTNILTMSVTEPAAVYIPNHIKKIGLLNRSESTANKVLDDIDKIFSAEGKNLDKEGAENLILGIKDEFEKNKFFETVELVNSDKITNPGLGIFPNTLPWSVVNQICTKNAIDALVVLSFYDTDAAVSYSTKTIEKSNVLGVKIPMIEHTARINTKILAGLRIYDNASKTILDEVIRRDKSVSIGRGINPIEAAKAVIQRKEAILQISNTIGQSYALRVYPFKIRVSRNYYVSGTKNFKIAKRRALTGDWNGAAKLWEVETKNRDDKIAGRAYYNMGIINEINGNLDAAIDWVSKAFTDFKNRNALRYLKILQNRKAKMKLLANQNN